MEIWWQEAIKTEVIQLKPWPLCTSCFLAYCFALTLICVSWLLIQRLTVWHTASPYSQTLIFVTQSSKFCSCLCFCQVVFGCDQSLTSSDPILQNTGGLRSQSFSLANSSALSFFYQAFSAILSGLPTDPLVSPFFWTTIFFDGLERFVYFTNIHWAQGIREIQ